MKSLHRKISIVVLAGLVLAGGGLAGSLSVANADSIDFQAEVDFNSLKDYGQRAGFQVIYGSNGDAKDLDEGEFGSASEVCNFIYGNKDALQNGASYKVKVGDADFIIKVAPSGIQEADPEDAF